MASIRQSLYNFKEQRILSLSHDLKVYIFGVDVSPWLRGELTINYGNRDSYNTASFDLANPRQLWQLTRNNLMGKWNKAAASEYSELLKLKLFKYKNNESINPYYSLEVRTNVLSSMQERISTSLEVIQSGGGENPLSPKDLAERRYRLAVNDCIFSRHDPMRIFMRNPYNATSDEWVEIFCGFVQDHPVTTNYINGESNVRISGYCIRQLMNKMRTQINAYKPQTDNPKFFEKGFFADFSRPSLSSNLFAQYSLEATIRELVLGYPLPDLKKKALLLGGIGDFKIGNVVCFTPPDPNSTDDTLERWHLMTTFGVNKKTFPSADDELWLTSAEMQALGDSTVYYPESDLPATGPTGRYLHFLLPAEGTGASSLVQYTTDQNVDTSPEWTSRWAIIRDFATKLDFQVMTSPSGDLLVEFPMYGFTPEIFFGNRDKKYVNPPTGLASLFCFDKHQKESTLNDEAEDFPTVLQVDGAYAFTNVNIAQGDSMAASLRCEVYSPAHVARYGVIVEQVSIPYAGQRGDESTGPESTMSKRLPKLGLLEYMKRMSDASTLDGTVVYRPFLFPNRPVWMMRNARIGLLTSVAQRWTIGKSADTSLAMHMLMAERIDPTTGDRRYVLPTGSADAPISYSTIWDSSDIGVATAGVYTTMGSDSPSTISSDQQPEAKGSGVPPPVDSPDLDDPRMYPPFAAAFKDAINKAQTATRAQVVLKYGFRTPEYQAYLMAHRGTDPKTGIKYPCKEPFLSKHQYGLAVDVDTDKTSTATLLALVAYAEDVGITWGGRWKNPDHPHFEWPQPSQSVLNKNKNLDPKTKVNYWKPIQDSISGLTPATAATTTSTPPPSPATSGSLASPTEQIISSEPSKKCSPVSMPEAGLKSVKQSRTLNSRIG